MARPRAYDHEQIAAMARQGIPDPVIAERIGCSVRTARRVREKHRVPAGEPCSFWGSNDERALWGFYLKTESYRKVAWRFGVSHEKVRTAMQDYYQCLAENRGQLIDEMIGELKRAVAA